MPLIPKLRVAGVTGLKDLSAVLNQLPVEVRDKVMRDAMGTACKPIEDAARSMAPVKTGALKKSIAHKVLQTPGSPDVRGLIGPSRDYFAPNERGAMRKLSRKASKRGAARPSNYAHLVERGHLMAGGKRVPPHPFMRPAFISAAPATGSAFALGMAAGLEKARQRLVKSA
jgi:HK97 gp10 family phage protein